MFSDQDLRGLLDYSSKGKVLSVYLNTDPTEVQAEAAKIQLRNLLKMVDLQKDTQTVELFVNHEYDWGSKGLILFSNQSGNTFQAFQIGLPVPNRVFTSDHPVLRPLINLLDYSSDWGLVLVDKQGARLFSFHMGDLEEVGTIVGDEVKQFKHGTGGTLSGRKSSIDPSGKVEAVIDRNIKEIIDQTTVFFTRRHIRRIMLGGSDENVVRFKENLPKAWQSLVASTFPMSMTASHLDILHQATLEALAVQTKINQSLVEQAITLAAKGSNGVTGLIDTLNAIHEGRIKTVLVLQDFDQAGYQCLGCGFLTVQKLDVCPFCSSKFELIDHTVEMAVQETLKKNAQAKVLLENKTLADAGQIAAILRY